ncbi:MAG TPA: GGDEF domain-containing protein [Rhodospirillaceae bacterium]|nr:MAG: hypothetical protein A2018_04635 [Alphaproteobacteria bacterium GWF2_58_20]HAU28806.1 GGDEF domain-containing protein [Rhodospirillaceae bacterium]
MHFSHTPALPEADASKEVVFLDLLEKLKDACIASSTSQKQTSINKALTAIHDHVLAMHAQIKILEGMVQEDALTGILNQHGFFKELHKEISRSQRHPDRGLCLIVVDLDDFKAINDTLGHPAGDACLQMAASTLKASIRESDSVARLGGDDFAIIMGDISDLDILQRTTEIRDRLNGSFLPWEKSTIHVHGSIGYSIYKDGDTEKDMIHRADRSLYQQKKMKEHQGS